MLLIAGTVPIENFPLVCGQARLEGDFLCVENYKIPCGMGTAAMISSAVEICSFLECEPPVAMLAGDIGDAAGSRLIYAKLINELEHLKPDVLALHYLQPVMGLMKKIVSSVNRLKEKPVLMADAGAMYAAKAAGLAASFQIFTPDNAEMKFLADPDAMHPAYVSNYFIQTDSLTVGELAESVYKNKCGPEFILMKGKSDHLIAEGKIVAVTDYPDVPELEPVGGTGDTITGLMAGLVYSGLDYTTSALIATRLNRMAGHITGVRPDTSVREIIKNFNCVLKDNYIYWKQEFAKISCL